MADEILPNSGMELPDIGGDQDTWGDILNENLRILDRAITLGAESIALAATDVTLDEDQATKGVLRLSGVLTANVNVVVPASPVRLYLVENNTTGAFTVAIKTPLGTGVTVLQGTSSLVYSNGTNVVQGATSVNGSFAVSGALNAGSATVTGSLSAGSVSTASAAITGGSINNTAVGATTPSTGAFTTLSASGAASFADGTAALPSITNTGDTNTGVFFPAADTVGVSTAGSERLRMTVAGNLLVGTTTDVSGTVQSVSTGAVFRATSSSASSGLYTFVGPTNSGQITNPSGAIDIATNGGTSLSFTTNSTERGRFTSGGYFKASNTGSYGGVAGVADLSAGGQHVIQSTGTIQALAVINSNGGAGAHSITSYLPTGAAGLHFEGRTNNVAVYRVLANGDVQNTNNSYGAISDAKLKNIIAARDGKHYWEKFKKIKFWIYSLLADPTNQQLLGVVAQEFQDVFPGLVNASPDMHAVKKTRELTSEVQVTEPVEKEQTRTEIVSVNGRYVQKQITETVTVDEPVFDQFPLYDETGALVMQLVSAEEPAQFDEEGEEISPAKPAVYAPVVHQVPRMTTVTTTEEYEEMEPNGEVTLSVNYSILGLIADTITQELQFRVEDLTARVEALEAQ